MSDPFVEILQPVKFWKCINPAHPGVEWDGQIATCTTCGLTSAHTLRHDIAFARAIAEQFERMLHTFPAHGRNTRAWWAVNYINLWADRAGGVQ